MPPEPAPRSPDLSAQSSFVARVNQMLAPRAAVVPYAILPEALWQGHHGAFLSRVLGHTPDQPWNTMLLPADRTSAAMLHLPMAPQTLADGFLAAAEDWVATLSTRVMTAQRQAGDAAGFRLALKDASDDLFAFAHASAVKRFGDAAYQRHLALFGDLLRWEHRDRFLKPVRLERTTTQTDLPHQIPTQFTGAQTYSERPFFAAATAQTAEVLDTLRAADLQRRRLVEAVNARLGPDAEIAAYDILPAALWTGADAGFLTGTLNVWPAGRANTMLLPATAEAAAKLGLPVHPGRAPDAVRWLAEREVRRARTQLAGELRTEAVLRAGFQAFIREQAVAAIGEAAWLKHAGLFGAALDPDAAAPQR